MIAFGARFDEHGIAPAVQAAKLSPVNVDVYPLVSTLLGLPAAPSDGTCMIANELLKGGPVCSVK